MDRKIFGLLVVLGVFCVSSAEAKQGNKADVVDCKDLVEEDGFCHWTKQKKIKLNSTTQCDFHCWYNPMEKSPIRLGVHSLNNTLPAFVTMRQKDYAESWTIPIRGPFQNQFFGSIEVMACPTITYPNETLYISLATSVQKDIYLNLEIRNQSFDFSDARMEFNLSVSPVSAWYQLYQWKEGVDTIMVTVEPNSLAKDSVPVCSLLSLQDAECPAKTMPDVARSQGKYQTFWERAAMVASKRNFKNGVYVAVIPLMDNSWCLGVDDPSTNITKRIKQVTVKIETQQSIGSVWYIFLGTGIGLIAFLVLATIVIRKLIDKSLALEDQVDDDDEPLLGGGDTGILGGIGSSDMESSIGSRGSGAQSPLRVVQTSVGVGVMQTGPAPNMHVNSVTSPSEGDSLNNEESEDEGLSRGKISQPAIASAPTADSAVIGPESSIYPTLPKVFDEDLGQLVPRTMFAPASTHAPPLRTLKISNSYNPRTTWWWKTVHVWEGMTANSNVADVAFQHNLVIMAVFTALPMLQLVTHTLQMQSLSGNEDFCYYNAKCMVQALMLPDFSRVFTNLGYLVAGVGMLVIIHHHKNRTEKIWKRNIARTLPQEDRTVETSRGLNVHDVGVSRHYGLFTSLGLGLIVQGIMSGLYHFCPNSVTVRFDMMFMFLMAVVLVVGVWGFRHSDVTRHVYPTVGVVAVALVLSQCREWFRPALFWTLMDVMHLGLMTSTAVQLSLLDTWSFSPRVMIQTFRGYFPLMKKMREKVGNLNEGSMFNVLRGIRLGTAGATNIAIAMYGPIAQPDDVYMYILIICLANMGLYIFNYIGTKRVIHKEKGTRLAWISLTLAVILWPVALGFFSVHTVDTVSTPSMSRSYNGHCILWGVFDSHDIWHIASSLALFFSFVGVLTLDDDLAYRSSQTIPVF